MSELETALTLAARHVDDKSTTEAERHATLAMVATHLSGEIGETASRRLFHLREDQKLQLTFQALLGGIK